MSVTMNSSVLMLLRDAADEIRERPDSVKLRELAGLAFLAQSFGHDGFMRLFAQAFAAGVLDESEVRR